MGEVISLPAQRKALVAEHGQTLDGLLRLDNSTTIDGYTQLLPQATLIALRREIELSLRSAPPDFLAKMMAILGGSMAIMPSIEKPKEYCAAMMSRLAQYPAAILEKAVERASDSFDFMPSIKAMRGICDELMGPHRARLAVIDAMLAEHSRRREEATRERKEAEETRHSEAEREARWREIFGDIAPSFVEFGLAVREMAYIALPGGEKTSLGMALDQGEPQAATLCRRLAIARRARERGNGNLGVAIVKLAMTDEAAARHQLDEIDAGRLHVAPMTSDDDRQQLEDAINQIRRPFEPTRPRRKTVFDLADELAAFKARLGDIPAYR